MNQTGFTLKSTYWLTDPGVRALTAEERDFLVSLLCLMNDCQPRGTLTLNARPMGATRVSNMLGTTVEKAKTLLNALLEFDVIKRDEETGLLYCQWMVQHAALQRMRQEIGKRGGRPDLKAIAQIKQSIQHNQAPNQTDNQASNLNFTPDSPSYSQHVTAEQLTLADDFTVPGEVQAAGLGHLLQGTQPGKGAREEWIADDYAPSTQEWERIYLYAEMYYPLLSEEELKERLRLLLNEFRDYWLSMRALDLEHRTRHGKKKSWYMTFRARIKQSSYEDKRQAANAARAAERAALRQSQGNGNGNYGNATEVRSTVERESKCKFCAARAEDATLPPCAFHRTPPITVSEGAA
jgi:hypothetical protein